MTALAAEPFPFLRLPLELRESIYSLYFKPADRLVQNETLQEQGFYGGMYKFDLGLYRVNRQIHEEAKQVWRRENMFVKISTPWPSAGMYSIYLRAMDQRELVDFGSGPLNHISSEGLVPIVCIDQQAQAFTSHHAVVQISAPFHQAVPEHSVILLLDDLHLFTQTWYYSALSYPMLNDRLSTTFTLRDPDRSPQTDIQPSPDEIIETVGLPLQRRLLLPFEQVKDLYGVSVYGYAPSVREELETRMRVPVPSLQSCCEEATEIMYQGDAALQMNKAADGLALYIRAFKAIHILIHGRTRRVLADVFFHDGIEHGMYAGQTGMTVRVILRLRLVSRCVLACLQLEQWNEAAYWGMRSIRIMREAMDVEFQNFVSEFVGGADVGLIYTRTGVAMWMMERDVVTWAQDIGMLVDDKIPDSARLFELAVKYLKSQNKEPVRKELERFGIPQSTVRLFGDVEKEGSVVANAGRGEE